MKRTARQHDLIAAFALLGAAALVPVGAVSLTPTEPSAPLPDSRSPATPLALESWSSGSAALVPLMAVDLPARRAAGVDTPADNSGVVVGKPLDDLGFVRQATESARKEVAAARDALPQLRDPDLKRIAEMLVADHSEANARLSQLAESKGWPVPGPKEAAPAQQGAGGRDFEARWTAEMIAGHEKSVALYRAQANGGADQDLRRYARDTLPTIEHHLAELRSLQK